MSCNCNCNRKNGSDVNDFITLVPGGTAADATYIVGLTHYTCGNKKMLLADTLHPVKAELTATPVGTPIDLGDGNYLQECVFSGTVTYKPCGCCKPETEYITYRDYLPCSAATSPTLTVGTVVASPKPITYYVSNGCECCQQTKPCTNQIAITTSVNVTTA